MNKSKKIKEITILGIFISIIVIMAFTPLGYFKVGPLALTLIVMPVAIGAILLGPKGGCILGFVFGLTSFVQCFGLDAFGTTLFSISPALTCILCILPRTLMGFLTGLLFKVLNNKIKTLPCSMLSCFIASILNTILFMGFLCLFFYNNDFIIEIRENLNATNIFTFVCLFVGINAVVEAVCNTLIGGLITSALYRVSKND